MNKEGYHAPCRLLLLLGADSDDTRAFNWNRTDTTHFVGNEFSDPAAQGCGAFGQIPCRPSDAAMFTIPNDSSEFGYLARTESPSSGDNTGSRVIDTSNPRFTIGHRVLNPPQGDTVHKMGAAAGWTYGTIAQTCDEIGLDPDGDGSTDYIITCAYETDFRLDEGDSGGPVFYWSGGDNVTLVGVAVGHDGTITEVAGDGYFASLGAIDDDLGLMLVEDEPVNAFIPGPLTVPPDVVERMGRQAAVQLSVVGCAQWYGANGHG